VDARAAGTGGMQSALQAFAGLDEAGGQSAASRVIG
jgi:hypothetical protein